MQKDCLQCSASFEITEEDLAFYSKVAPKFDRQTFELPTPSLCPHCRHQQRALFRPRLRLHKRTSDFSGKPVLSVYEPTVPFPVCSVEEWWSDDWNVLDYGQPYDANRTFFEQFADLYNRVPKMANLNEQTENCEYSYACGKAKNVYYSLIIFRSEDVYYSERCTSYNATLVDCLMCFKSQHLYNCTLCRHCEYSTNLERCSDSGDCHYCVDCQGCTDCLFSWNLRNKTHYVHNQSVSPEEYARIRAETLDGKASTQHKNQQVFAELKQKAIYKALSNLNVENCTGDGLLDCANCHQCFNSINTEDCRYCIDLTPSDKTVSSVDFTSGGIGELIYNCVGLGGGNYHMLMCMTCRLCSDLLYCSDCFNTKHCFGCVGLRNKEYCIFNKQYPAAEYETLVAKIIKQMIHTGEWGQFFPTSLAPIGYNASLAMDMYPLSQEQIHAKHWQWCNESDEMPQVDKIIDAQQLPDALSDIPDDICNWALRCQKSSQPYRITPQELKFYRTVNLPIPRLHPDVRMEARRKLRNPYHLWQRPCGKCGEIMETSYAPERPEKVFCEKCYLETVY